MSTAAVIDHPQNGQSVLSDDFTKKLPKETIGVEKGTEVKTSRNKSTDADDEDQRTLETSIKKLLKRKKLSADFTHYELQMIWEAPVQYLKTRLNLASEDDVEFLQSLCCDLFLFDDNYKEALTRDELFKKEGDWEKKTEMKF